MIYSDCGALGLDEDARSFGPTIPYNSMNIVVLPDNPLEVDYDQHPELCWLKAPIRWGYPEAPAYWDFVEPLANCWPLRRYAPLDIGNNAVPGPFFHKGWDDPGVHEGVSQYIVY